MTFIAFNELTIAKRENLECVISTGLVVSVLKPSKEETIDRWRIPDRSLQSTDHRLVQGTPVNSICSAINIRLYRVRRVAVSNWGDDLSSADHPTRARRVTPVLITLVLTKATKFPGNVPAANYHCSVGRTLATHSRTVEPFERISGDQSMTRAIAVDIGGTINGVSIAGQNA